jgi:hypothetical protein
MSEIKNTILIATAVARLQENAATIVANHEDAKSRNDSLEIKALNEQIARLEARAAGEDRDDKKVYRFSVPSACTSCYDDMIDRLELLEGDSIAEGYVSRSLLSPVKPFDPETAAKEEIIVNTSSSAVITAGA